MRTLTITRERALAAFSMKYHVFAGGSRAEFLSKLEKIPMDQRKNIQPDFSLKNGETVRFRLEDHVATSFFAALFTETRNIVTNEVTIAPGTEDVSFTIKTLYDGHNKFGLEIVPTE